MTGVSHSVAMEWMAEGHEYFLTCLMSLTDEEVEGPSRLPGWTGKHLLSHVGHNARALGRLAHWAATGEETLMYPNPSARAAEIEAGAVWPVHRLRSFAVQEQDRLTLLLGRIAADRWQATVVTAQGRTVLASAIPWLRSREVWIHACDLPSGGDFDDFPGPFTDALIQDAVDRRRTAQGLDIDVHATNGGPQTGTAELMRVEGPAVDLARWLTRGVVSPRLRTGAGDLPPQLPPWL
ncbi:maleylpyruvate isomerase family mycothiol-dependent enzyme [Streptomyces sp. CA-106131]|uniref:maleylpyruvate isomerase family mycothiol-dependent enzyme n=1 Tax=Streptomyces sp. CA-106131 TaxID=3240045 RepID=UPI003D8AD4ED